MDPVPAQPWERHFPAKRARMFSPTANLAKRCVHSTDCQVAEQAAPTRDVEITHSRGCSHTASKEALPSAGMALPMASTRLAGATAPSQPRERRAGNSTNLCESAGPELNREFHFLLETRISSSFEQNHGHQMGNFRFQRRHFTSVPLAWWPDTVCLRTGTEHTNHSREAHGTAGWRELHWWENPWRKRTKRCWVMGWGAEK